jgi:hypothetical protein
MKTSLLLCSLVALLGLAIGCKPSHRVSYNHALISFDPGEGWKRLDIPVELPVCSPRLTGKAGMINVLLLAEFTDLKKAASYLQTSFSSNAKALPDTFKQEDFNTESGLTGIHISYSAQSPKSSTPDSRSHSFVTHNRRGQCVSVSYITSPTAESPAVIEAIQKTLRVE